MISLRKLLVRCVFIAFSVYCKVKVTLAYLFYPLVRYMIERELGSVGLKIVRGTRKRENEIAILKDEKKFFLSMAENVWLGWGNSYVDGLIDMDPKEVTFRVCRYGKSYWFFDEIKWIGKLFNLQVNELIWEVANHYNTGNIQVLIVLFLLMIICIHLKIHFCVYKSQETIYLKKCLIPTCNILVAIGKMQAIWLKLNYIRWNYLLKS